MGAHLCQPNSLILDVTNASLKENDFPWKYANNLQQNFVMLGVDLKSAIHTQSFKTGLKYFIMKYATPRTNSIKEKHFYQLDLIPRNYWGFDESKLQQLNVNFVTEYFTAYVELIYDFYENIQGERNPLFVELSTRAESNPPKEIIDIFLDCFAKHRIDHQFSVKIYNNVIYNDNNMFDRELMKPNTIYIKDETSTQKIIENFEY